MLYDIPEHLQAKHGVWCEENVTFCQLSAEANTNRDALKFENGRHVKLQELREGQRLSVLDLGGTEVSGSASETEMVAR
jgi:hypothetical protein